MTPGIQPTLVLVLFLVPTAVSNSTLGTTTHPDREAATTTAPETNSSNRDTESDRITTIALSATASSSTHRPTSVVDETEVNDHHSTMTIAQTYNSISTTSTPSDHHTSTTFLSYHSPTSAPTDHHTSTIPLSYHSPTSAPTDHHTSTIPLSHSSTTSTPTDHYTSTTPLSYHSPTSAPTDHHTSTTPLSRHSTTSEPTDHHTSTTPLSHHSTTSEPTDHHTSTTPLSYHSPTSAPTDHHTSTTPLSHHSTTSEPTDHHTSTTPLSHHSTTSASTDHHTSTTPTSHHSTIATKSTPNTIAATGNPTNISSTLYQKATPTPNNNHSSISQPVTISQSTSHLPVVIYERAVFFLSFRILYKEFNSSLENPSSSYYQNLKNSVNDLLWQTYKNEALVTFYLLQFRMGSVITDCILVFQEDSITTSEVQTLFVENVKNSNLYNLTISASDITVRQWNSEVSSTDSAVPGYAIALLVIVSILLALAIFYLVFLGLSQFRRKHCGQLDIFPSQDSYHPMNEYPPYHTHGRYMPPGNTKRSPYEEISPGNGNNSLSYVNPVATSANL
ncbi:mucin-1 [Trichosurus vulpecula]|uniref:mucin-1 n=1 Tax=Trichosurus vulpecula TaxID=9337 RepID=UPI00186B02B6|nr:mucin-1 [Trichosurus vulpecula]